MVVIKLLCICCGIVDTRSKFKYVKSSLGNFKMFLLCGLVCIILVFISWFSVYEILSLM